MSYIRAEEVLPKELIETIQQYVSGKCIYIPCNEKKVWGTETRSKEYYKNRNTEICMKNKDGYSVSLLSKEYSLSVKSIQRIIREYKASTLEEKKTLIEKEAIHIESNYRDNKELRDSFNELSEKIFELNFEEWYKNGFWKDNYNPYSVVIDKKVVSNVSVNVCDMECDGEILHLIQLGTVMTDPDYRGKGYSRILMEHIIKEYEDKVDGIYLFANDSVLDFYPKFGFSKRKEYQYSKAVSVHKEVTAQKVSMTNKASWDNMVQIINSIPQNGNFNMVGNAGLFMFYISQFMQDNVFYIEECQSFVVAETEDETLILHAIFGNGEIDKIVEAFGKDIKEVILCFTPDGAEGYEKKEIKEQDTTLFVRGRAFEKLRNYDFMFQSISHA